MNAPRRLAHARPTTPLRRRLVFVSLVLSVVASQLVLDTTAASAVPASCGTGGTAAGATCTYNGVGTDTFVVPAGVTQVTFDVFGGQGGTGNANGQGGLGGEARATVAVSAGQTYQISVGGAGSNPAYQGGRGGGGSDIRSGACAATLTCGLTARTVAAGGGGGGGGWGFYHQPGQGGAGSGGDGTSGTGGVNCGYTGGQGGTATTGGPAGGGASSQLGSAGTLGTGGTGGTGSGNGGGGGGGGDGYYGGGGGTGANNVCDGSGGGGGSGTITPTAITAFTATGTQTGNGKVIVDPQTCRRADLRATARRAPRVQ